MLLTHNVIAAVVGSVCVIVFAVWYYYRLSSQDNIIIAVIPHALTDGECDAMIQHAKSCDMQTSTVINKSGGEYDVAMDQRNSKTIWFSDSEHEVADKMAKLASQYTHLPRSHQEKTQVVCYDVGGKFDAHHDAQYNSGAATRAYTCLVYLNDDYDGGETVFTDLETVIRPKKGTMLVFRNLDYTGKILPKSVHRANAVEGANKWICTKWVHSGAYRQ